MGAALLTTGRRTVANLLRTLAPPRPRPPHHLPARSSPAPLVRPAPGLRLWPASCSTTSLPDRPGRSWSATTPSTATPASTVYGKARHRDPVRSTHAYTAWRYGHKWVVLAVLVRFPFATRPWALPVLVDLYRSRRGRPQAPPAAPHPGPAHVPAAAAVCCCGSPTGAFVFVGRRRLRHPRGGPLLPPPPRAG